MLNLKLKMIVVAV